jgi:hypothetical protein
MPTNKPKIPTTERGRIIAHNRLLSSLRESPDIERACKAANIPVMTVSKMVSAGLLTIEEANDATEIRASRDIGKISEMLHNPRRFIKYKYKTPVRDDQGNLEYDYERVEAAAIRQLLESNLRELETIRVARAQGQQGIHLREHEFIIDAVKLDAADSVLADSLIAYLVSQEKSASRADREAFKQAVQERQEQAKIAAVINYCASHGYIWTHNLNKPGDILITAQEKPIQVSENGREKEALSKP